MASTQAARAPRPSIPHPTIVDQISVHITKALKDGLDRIDIQLRPPQWAAST